MDLSHLTPVNVDGSKKIFREDVLSHALDHPTKFQPDPSSHLGVYRDRLIHKSQVP